MGGSAYYVQAYWGKTPGIHNDANFFSSSRHRGILGIFFGVLFIGFYLLLYFLPDIKGYLGSDSPPGWFAPLQPIFTYVLRPEYFEAMIRITEPLAEMMRGVTPGEASANRWFLYGFLYTAAVTVFGVRIIMRYRHSRYQLLRTISVIFFQLVLAFVLPHFLYLTYEKEFYFSYFWPLKPDYFYPNFWPSDGSSSVAIVRFFFLWAALMSFVATPILTYVVGKRWYCSWVCGCGGLAETLGDQWRHLSDKSDRAWRIERYVIYSVLLAICAGTALLWIDSTQSGQVLGEVSGGFKQWYGLIIVQVFAGVVGTGFYPFLGNRVWCRFGCPMAAILGLFQKTTSRFRITTNGGQCMSCGNCSTYCEMGIDVRAYAQRRANIVRASCVGCGICSAVCPRGVLKLENGPLGNRFEGSESPAGVFTRIITQPPNKNRDESRPQNPDFDAAFSPTSGSDSK